MIVDCRLQEIVSLQRETSASHLRQPDDLQHGFEGGGDTDCQFYPSVAIHFAYPTRAVVPHVHGSRSGLRNFDRLALFVVFEPQIAVATVCLCRGES